MNKTKESIPLCCVVCLVLVLVFPFYGSVKAQEESVTQPSAANGARTTLADAVRKSAGHDRSIERFSVNNADLRAVFKQLSEFSGTDIVLGDKVAGTVTLNVTNKTWREIMGIICKIANLTAIREPSYIYVVPSDDYRKQQVSDATINQQEEALEELKREVIQCNNAKAEEMMASVQSLLSTRGKITLVGRNNALIIYDTPDNIAQIRKTIQELDVETNQVFISCKIIDVSSGVAKDLGIGWGYFDRLGGTDVSATHMPGFSVPGELERLTFGILSQDKLSATLSLLFQNTGAEIVAQPQITTLDNQEATVFLGSQVPIQTMTTAGGAATPGTVIGTPTVTMVDAGTNLVVTPHVTSEKRVMLTLSATKSSYTLTGTGTNPIINKQSAQTHVVVSDGETVVIAGLTSNETQNVDEGIPVLKDIPLLGNLFKHSKKTVKKDDLMIFVTPHIINKKVEAITGAAK
jgi:type II secretory pathway component HofQ